MIALTVGAPAAHAVENGTYPTETPVVYPGTSQPIESWRLVGQAAASAVQIAPRWVVATRHAPVSTGVTFSAFGRGSATVIDWSVPKKSDGTDGGGISLGLLDHALAAPAGGFPLLLDDPFGPELGSSGLPGYTLSAGLGGMPPERSPEPLVGWSDMAGHRDAGLLPLTAVGGDSGSTVFWYPSAESRPVMHGVTAAAGDARFDGSVGFAERIGSDPFADTYSQWLRARFAEHAETPAAEFTRLSDLGIDFTTLRPAGPAQLRVSGATPSTVTLAWNNSTDLRLSRTGYRLRQPGKATVELPATATTYTASGLTPGENATFELRAVNANGESLDHELLTGAASYAVRTGPAVVRDLAVTARREVSNKAADYCVDAEWAAPVPLAGNDVTSYRATFDGQPVSSTFAAGSPRVFTRCGLEPTSRHTFSVVAVSDLTVGTSVAEASATTPSGAALGTPIGAATNVRPTARMASVGGKLDRCIDVSWTAPTPVDGFPVTGFTLALQGTAWGIGSKDGIPAGVTDETICGVAPSDTYVATIYSEFDAALGHAQATKAPKLVFPAGAPNGTTIPAASGVVATPRLDTTSGIVAYCVDLTWTIPTVSGLPVEGFSIVLTGSAGTVTADNLPGSARTRSLCGLKPGSAYRPMIYTEYGLSLVTVTTAAQVTTMAGAAAGTALKPVTALSVTKLLGCAAISWTLPASIAGVPVVSQDIVVTSTTGAALASALAVGPTVKSKTLCGVGSGTITMKITSRYAGGGTVSASLVK